MLTGSEDGLMCFLDTEVSIEEDVSCCWYTSHSDGHVVVDIFVIARVGAHAFHPLC